MRARSASVVFSSIILGSALARVEAQSLGLDTLPALNPPPDEAMSDPENLPPGVIPQPSVDFPGVVLGITLGELYTDNLTLAASGTPKQSNWITEIRPFIKSAYSSPRFSGLLNYTLTGYLYAGQSSYNQVAQDLYANGTLIILPQHLFLDGGASYRREIISNEFGAGSGSYFLNNNQANVAIGTLSPYWLQDLGRVGTMTLRYTRGRVVYNDRGISGQDPDRLSGIPDVTSDAVQFDLVSPEFQTLGWNLAYADQRLDPDFGSSVRFAQARLGTSLQVSNELQLLADVGKEDKFLPDGTEERLGSSFWDVGFAWSNTRDSFRAMAGRRFYGRSYQLSWTHQAALLTTKLSYVEQPTTYNRQLLGSTFGTGVTRPISVSRSIPSLTELRPYLSKRWTATAAYTMPKSKLTVTVYDESRAYFIQDSTSEQVANADVSWPFDLGPVTGLTPGFDWRRYRFRSGQVSYRRYAQLVLAHQFNAKNSASLWLRRDSETVYAGVPGAHGYDANVIFLQWTHLF